VARLLGLCETTVVYQGGGDAFIGLLGLNVTRPGKIGLITGSSNVLAGFVTEEFHALVFTAPFRRGDTRAVPGEGGQSSTGSNLAWFKRTFSRELPEGEAYRILGHEAAAVPPGASGLVALDYFQGNRTRTPTRRRAGRYGACRFPPAAGRFSGR